MLRVSDLICFLFFLLIIINFRIDISRVKTSYETLGDLTLTEKEARDMLGVGPELTEEEKEDLREHGAGLIDDREGINFTEFDYRVLQAKQRVDREVETEPPPAGLPNPKKKAGKP